MASETYTQVAPDSTGDKIRNIAVATVDDTGTSNTVSMQVVTPADPLGRLVDPSAPGVARTLSEIRTELRIISYLLVEAFGLKADPVQLRNDKDFTGEFCATSDDFAS
jgi:hypothetical protein